MIDSCWPRLVLQMLTKAISLSPGLLVRVVEQRGLPLGDVVHLLAEEREAALHVVQVRRLQQRRPRHQHRRRARDALRVRLEAQRVLKEAQDDKIQVCGRVEYIAARITTSSLHRE